MRQGTKSFVTRIAIELDERRSTDQDVSSTASDLLSPISRSSTGRSTRDAILDDALRHSIYAYAARWLPVRSALDVANPGDTARSRTKQQQIREQFWYKAREGVHAALTRPSWRSVLALLLFTLTEMPINNDDPGISDLCTQTLFHHFVRLTSPFKQSAARPLAQSTTSIPLAQTAVEYSMPPKQKLEINPRTQHLQDSIYWLGVLCDSSRSLIRQSPPVLLPGRSGERRVWDFIRQRTVIFDQSFRVLHDSPLPLPADVIVVVLQHASACKTMYLGVLNQFCDAAFYHKLEPVEDAARRVSDESRRFHDVFDRLLAMCAREYLTMSSENQIHYRKFVHTSSCMVVVHEVLTHYTVLLITHYHLGSLILADMLDTLGSVPEPLSDPNTIRLNACKAIINALTLPMNYDRYSQEDSPYASRLLCDPTPELMVEVLARTGNAIFTVHRDGKIEVHTAQIMLSFVFSALTVLCAISVSASFVLSSLTHIASSDGLKIKTDNQSSADGLVARQKDIQLLSRCDTQYVGEFLREAQIQTNMNILTLDGTIKKYEKTPSSLTSTVSQDSHMMDDVFASCSSALEASASAFQASLNETWLVSSIPTPATSQAELSVHDVMIEVSET